MMARFHLFRQAPGIYTGLLLAAVVQLGGCGTGGSNDRTSQPHGNAAAPQGIIAAATPPEPSEGPTGEPTPAEAHRQGQGDAAGKGTRPYPTEVSQPTAPSRPRPAAPAAPAERRFAKKSEVYDPAGSHFDLLQAPREALRNLPIDTNGRVDWVRALDQGLIAPRASRTGVGSMQVLDQDIIMKNTREMPWVRFPHRQHTEWLACSNCHTSWSNWLRSAMVRAPRVSRRSASLSSEG